MGGSQMFLVLGALVLLSILILNINRTWSGAEDQKLNAEFIMTATNVGQNFIDEISSKLFDQTLVLNPNVTNVNDLTAPNSLGKDTGENDRSDFNDVDDYKDQSFTVSTPRLGDFNISVKVNYVSQDNLEITNVRTWTKKIEVNITNKILPEEYVNLYYFKSY